jgi:hypothetical protein
MLSLLHDLYLSTSSFLWPENYIGSFNTGVSGITTYDLCKIAQTPDRMLRIIYCA